MTPADMRECEDRNGFGLPATGWQHRGNGGVYAPIDASNNKALPWTVLAALFGGLGFGGVIVLALMSRGQIEAEGRAVRAEVRAEFAQQLAALRSDMDVAKYEASIAKNTVQKLEARQDVRR